MSVTPRTKTGNYISPHYPGIRILVTRLLFEKDGHRCFNKTMRKQLITAVLVAASMLLTSCNLAKRPEYTLAAAVEVTGRQGVCSEGDYYWVSGSKTLAKYDREISEVFVYQVS